jgi:hypothetical protein
MKYDICSVHVTESCARFIPEMSGCPKTLDTDGTDMGGRARMHCSPMRGQTAHLLAAQIAAEAQALVHARHVRALVRRRRKGGLTAGHVTGQPHRRRLVHRHQVLGQVLNLRIADGAHIWQLPVHVDLVCAQLTRP